MSQTVKQKALVTPFNLQPDGTVSTLVAGVGLAEYATSKSLAVFLIFQSTDGQQMSVELPEHAEQLDENEFFLKDWADLERTAETCIQEGLFVLTDKQPVQAGDRLVKIARVSHVSLRDMNAAETEHFKP